MTLLQTEPIRRDWTIDRPSVAAGSGTAAAVVDRLALVAAADIDASLRPLLAAAAAELAPAAGFAWSVDDDPSVALVRLIAAAAARAPEAGGPHTARLLAQLPA